MPTVEKTHVEKDPTYLKAGFNLKKRIEERNPATGQIIRKNPYRMYVVSKIRYIEWPVGSGNLYAENGDGLGRIEDGKIYLNKSHQTWTPPLTADEKVARENATLKQELDRLKSELADIKREDEMKAFVAKEESKSIGARMKKEAKGS